MDNENEQPAGAPEGAPEAGSPSLEDRIAAKLMGPTSAEDAEEATPEAENVDAEAEATEETTAEAAPEAETDEIELEGVKYTVPKELKDAFMAKSDYTRKTQEVANARRQAEVLQTQLQLAQAERAFVDSITSEAQTIALIDARSKELIDNWASLTADQKQDLMLLDKQREQINNAIQSKRNQFLQSQEQAMNELRTKAMEAVSKAIPGWSDKVKTEIAEHAKSDGYTDQELSQIIDPRHAKTLWKAMQYDRLQAKARSVVKASPVAKTAPVKPMADATKSLLNFRKTISKAAPGSPEYKQALQDRIAAKFGG